MPGQHGLGDEELMPEVDGLGRVPLLRRDVLERVALVVGRVVDQRPDRPEAGLDLGRRRRAARPRRSGRTRTNVHVVTEFRAPAPRPPPVDVEEGDPGAVADEAPDDRLADAGRAARHDDRTVPEARIHGRERGRRSPRPGAAGWKSDSSRRPSQSEKRRRRRPTLAVREGRRACDRSQACRRNPPCGRPADTAVEPIDEPRARASIHLESLLDTGFL